MSPGSDPHVGVIQTLSLLAVPGLMLTFWMRFSPYFFVSYSMIVMGFVMVFKWDSLFPDRRDYLILGSLPIRYRDIFLAKIKALFLFLAMFAVSSNIFPALMVPFAGGRGTRQTWWFALAHIAGVFGGALFMAVGFAALQGVLITIFPDRVFRRISPIIQMISIALLLTIFLIFPLIDASIRPLAERSSELMHYFPMFWFLGLYVSILPIGDPSPVFGALAVKAIYGLLIVSTIFLLTYAVAYRRHARSVLNAMDGHPPRAGVWRFLKLDRLLQRHPTQHGSFRFIGEILSRSAKHQVFLAVYLAIGLSLGLSSLFTVNPSAAFPFAISKDGMLALPLILSFFVVSGLRATFNIPYELAGNWIFQITSGYDAREHVTAAQKWVAVWGLAPLAIFASVVEFAYWPWKDASFHLAFEAIVSLALVQVLFFNFQKAAFTCSYYPGRRNIAILAAVYLYGFTAYSSTMVALEQWLQLSAGRAVAFAVVGVGVIVALASARRRKPTRLIYEEESGTGLQGLELN